MNVDELSTLHEGLSAADAIVSKLVEIGEVARIARIETLLRGYLWLQWQRVSQRAVNAAVSAFRAGKGESQVADTLDAVMEGFGTIVASRLSHDIEEIYKLGKMAAFKKGTGRTRGSLQYAMPVSVTKARDTSLVVVVAVPPKIAKQYPPAKTRGGDDSSPPHFTVIYIADGRDRRDEAIAVVQAIAIEHEPFKMTLSTGVSWFETDRPDVPEDEKWIAHKGLAEGAAQLEALHWQLVAALTAAGFEPSVRDDFKPHSTLRYCSSKEYDGPIPEGSFVADTIEVWSDSPQSERIPLGVQKAKKKPKTLITGALDLVDRGAIKALQRSQSFWVGDFFTRNLSPLMRRIISSVMIAQSQDRSVGGKVLEKELTDRFGVLELPGGWKGTARAYWESSAANIATTARSHSQMRSFQQLEFDLYEIVNPQDERTCPVCQHLDGMVFRVEAGMRQMEADLKAKTPDQVKDAHPWLNAKQLTAIAPVPGSAGGLKQSSRLGRAGFALPPFHFRCRCTVDITSSIESGGAGGDTSYADD